MVTIMAAFNYKIERKIKASCNKSVFFHGSDERGDTSYGKPESPSPPCPVPAILYKRRRIVFDPQHPSTITELLRDESQLPSGIQVNHLQNIPQALSDCT
jgi:hypothetical protein